MNAYGCGATVLVHEATFSDELCDEAAAKKHTTTGQVGLGPSPFRVLYSLARPSRCMPRTENTRARSLAPPLTLSLLSFAGPSVRRRSRPGD